ncbi:MAG: sigma-70 family RNA polymerase sigma factor [Fimbriimonadales bacterium]|nr:sigma-70 family RNA polymerase sigma factor [Fimbriimonadales bacterium]
MRDERRDTLNRLAQEAQQGDGKTLEALLEECRLRLQRYFRTRARSAEDCEDLVQEVLLRVSNALPKTELNAPFDHWLYRIAANCLITYYSRVHRHHETAFTQLSNPESIDHLQQDSFEASLLERIADEQTQAMLVRVVKEVCSDAEQRVILMHAQHETPSAIAQMLQMSPATVRTHLMRGRAKVLAHLIQHRPELLGGAHAIQEAVAALERDGNTPLTEAERRALQEPKPNQTDLRRAALKLAKYLRLE